MLNPSSALLLRVNLSKKYTTHHVIDLKKICAEGIWWRQLKNERRLQVGWIVEFHFGAMGKRNTVDNFE